MPTLTQTYSVSGMTCSHCVASVTEELSEITAVRSVEVDLPTGAVTVSLDAPLDDADARGAIETAGYTFNGPIGL